MRFTPSNIIGFPMYLVFLAAGCVAQTTPHSKLRIGDPCDDSTQCGATDALCTQQVDMLRRCWSMSCKEDEACGPDAHCLTDADPGGCYLACETVDDCPRGSSNSRFYCEPVEGGRPDQGYCILELFPTCGNGIEERGEECDDGNYVNEDGCTADCMTEVGCGNGRLDVNIDEKGFLWEEECDDDNIVSGDGCSAGCRIEGPGPVCGNGILEAGEGCDPPEPSTCTQMCKRIDGCGDGQQSEIETCDDGNNVSGDGCDADCRLEYYCGDGYCESAAMETCEKCPADCCPACGNGVLDEGEECDDGGNAGGDGCSKGCLDEDYVATCGNNIWEQGEECEDGNVDPGDGCAADCTLEFVCGDGICESDKNETCEKCPADCCPDCGNGLREIQYGEKCDTNDLNGKTCLDFCYDGGTLVCTSWCEFDLSQCSGTGPICGDNVAECEEQCDNNDLKGNTCVTLGYESGALGCDDQCTLDLSGCNNLLWYLSEDFETTSVANWYLSGDWEVGAPYLSEEPDAHGGLNCAGTVIGGYHSSYSVYETNTMITPAINLTTASNPVLVFYQWLYTYDMSAGGTLWVSNDNGISWSYLDNTAVDPDYYLDWVCDQQYYGYAGFWSYLGWHQVTVDLSPFAGQTIRIRFSFCAMGWWDQPGWYIDDVLITEAAYVPVNHTSGTDLGNVVVANEFSRKLTASGGTGSYTWSVLNGQNIDWLTLDSGTGILHGTADSTQVGPGEITVRVEEATLPSNYQDRTYTFNVVESVFFESFESSQPAGWTFGTSFQWGMPSVAGPTSCSGGMGSCVGTVMNGNYPDYCTRETCTLVTPSIDLAGTSAPFLAFHQYIDSEPGWDGGNLFVSSNGGVTWTYLDDLVVDPDYYDLGNDGMYHYGGDYSYLGWHQVFADLTAYAGQTIQIRFSFYSDSSYNYSGWYLDEVLVAE